MLVQPGGRKSLASCHPERSEGSGGDERLCYDLILRFAQDDKGVQDDNDHVISATVYERV